MDLTPGIHIISCDSRIGLPAFLSDAVLRYPIFGLHSVGQKIEALIEKLADALEQMQQHFQRVKQLLQDIP